LFLVADTAATVDVATDGDEVRRSGLSGTMEQGIL
jgi:hypothetical protein